MGRGPKFAFPIPGRKSHTNTNNDRDNDHAILNAQWSPRVVEAPSYSKAERLLGTAGLPFRPSSRTQMSVPPSPGYMTVTVSEASFDGQAESMRPPERPAMSNRPSSNLLRSAYGGDERRGSQSSVASRQLAPQKSNSTMRSYYDPQTSPLAVSQQTSASAVRDMALRKGKPPVAHQDDNHLLRPSSRQAADDLKKDNRKSKPARLDLSMLFPKPRSNGSDLSMGALLSPNKLVNSPSALSSSSEYFPRPMTREPTPTQHLHTNSKPRAKLTKSPKRPQAPSTKSAQRSTSPVRLHERDTYDNAKIHVRRPPRGAQHWFDALDGESTEEDYEEEPTPVAASHPRQPNGTHVVPTRKSSAGRLTQTFSNQSSKTAHNHPRGTLPNQEAYAHPSAFAAYNLKSPSGFSNKSELSLATAKTKESSFSKGNLQESSVLSMSSSEDEEEEDRSITNKSAIRDSIASNEDQGEILIGKAQLYDIRPMPQGRRTSDSKLSMRTNSTSAATIEVMYTPEPYAQAFPRPATYGSRRSSHVRQPSMIPEDEDDRPRPSAQRPMSPTSLRSARSAHTSTSEPRGRPEGRKLMAVTEEEEALLDMMRKKRAAMAKQSFTEGYKTALSQDTRQKTPPESKDYRTSGFLSNETPAGSPARAVTNASRKSSAPSPPFLHPPPRGRVHKSSQDLNAATSILRDSSSCDESSLRRSSPSPRPPPHIMQAHRLSPPPEFSPFDPFPSPLPTPTPTDASVASPTTTDYPSPLPSPITPGQRHADVDVKVAGSEPSCNGDNEEVSVLDIELPTGASTKPSSRAPGNPKRPEHYRRRTASSGANVAVVPLPPCINAPSSAASHDLEPKIPHKSSKRSLNGLRVNTTTTTAAPISRHSSQYSMRSASNSPAVGPADRRMNKGVSRGNSIASSKRDSNARARCSVNEDVLAAWGNLGGWRDFDSGRIM